MHLHPHQHAKDGDRIAAVRRRRRRLHLFDTSTAAADRHATARLILAGMFVFSSPHNSPARARLAGSATTTTTSQAAGASFADADDSKPLERGSFRVVVGYISACPGCRP